MTGRGGARGGVPGWLGQLWAMGRDSIVRNGLLTRLNKCCVRVEANRRERTAGRTRAELTCVAGVYGVACGCARAQSFCDAWLRRGNVLAIASERGHIP